VTPTLVAAALAIGAGLSAIRATAPWNEVHDLDLFAVGDDEMADVDVAVQARVRAVLVVVEIMISGEWVRWVRGRLLCGPDT